LPRLLQQLHRKKLTGRFVVTDQTGDQSDVYMREGQLVHVGRPVDTDRLDNLLVQYGLVSPEIVARASQQLAPGTRLGEVLDRMGALDKGKLAQVLKSQVLRKLTRLFFVASGSYAVYVEAHGYGDGEDLALMRVDPRTVIYPGIRAAYDLPRVTQELARLCGKRFRLGQVSSGFLAALGLPAHDSTVESLYGGWLTLDDLDAVTARPLEVRAIVLSLYYCDLLERESLAETKLPNDSGPAFAALPDAVVDVPASASLRLPAPGMPYSSPPGPAAGLGRPVTTAASPAVLPPPVGLRPNVAGETAQAISPSQLPARGSVPASTPSIQTAAASVVRTPVLPAVAKAAPSGNPARASVATSPEVLRAGIVDMAAKLDRLNHFEALGVSQSASPDDVGIAFVRAARQFHPDRLSSAGLQDLQPVAERILARINEASMVLGDAGRRAEYVASLNAGPQATSATLPTVLEAENSFLKGEVFLKKGEHAKAIECFTQATQGNPSEPQYRAYLAWARFDDPRARKESIVRETLKVVDGVVQARPRFARGHYWVGLLWKFLNEPVRAEQAFAQAVAVDSSFIDASRELRLIEMRKTKGGASKPEPSRGGGAGLLGKLFKK
jgi:hypothetical protein